MATGRIWLLNPPSRRRVLRDYYCSKISKAFYLYEPVDLLMLSAIFADEDLLVTDAVAEGKSVAHTLALAPTGEEDVIFGLIGAATASEDMTFYAALRQQTRARIYLSGDLAQDPTGEALLRLPFANGLLLDFADAPGLRALVVQHGPGVCASAAIRLPDGTISPAATTRAGGHPRAVGTPRHDLFPLHRYNYPFVRRKPFATLLTDFGCAYACTFCVMSSIGFATRPAGEVAEELRQLKAMGVRELYVSDQTFGAHRGHTQAMLPLLGASGMGWVCFTRGDLLRDGGLARDMAQAGCHTVMLGVESIHTETQKRVKKFAEQEKVEAGIAAAKKAGLKVLGTFLVGLPGETLADAEATLDWALTSGLDYASVNLAVPRNRTALANETGGADQDQGGGFSQLVDEDMLRFYNRFGLRFYARPRVAWGLMREMARPARLKVLAPEAWGLLRRTVERGAGTSLKL